MSINTPNPESKKHVWTVYRRYGKFENQLSEMGSVEASNYSVALSEADRKYGPQLWDYVAPDTGDRKLSKPIDPESGPGGES